MLATLVLLVAVVSANVARSPVEAWYKQVAGPSYYPVGRASGLLSGIRKWPYVRRAELEATQGGESAGSDSALTEAVLQKNFPLKTMVSFPLPDARVVPLRTRSQCASCPTSKRCSTRKRKRKKRVQYVSVCRSLISHDVACFFAVSLFPRHQTKPAELRTVPRNQRIV